MPAPFAKTSHPAAPPETLASAALVHLAAQRSVEAIAVLDALPASFAIAAGQAHLIGRVYMLAGAPSKALVWFDSALRTDPSFIEAIVNRARALAALGDSPKAIEAFALAFSRGWRDPVALYDHANLLRAGGDLDGAIASYDQALRLKQAYPECLRAGGCVLRDLGNIEAALRFLGEALRLDPAYIEAALDLGNLLLAQRQFDEAVAVFDAALRHRPGHAMVLTNRGVALHELGRLAEARDGLAAAIEADPTLAQAHLNHANVLARMGRHAEALPSMDEAIRLSPHYPAAHSTRGLILKMVGRYEDAAAAFETALAQAPDSPFALANRGELRLLQGDLAHGWPDYERRFLTHWQAPPHVAPSWTGAPSPGARIAVFADQGLGDHINFVRFLPSLVAADLDVTFVCRRKMQRVFAKVTSGVRVVEALPAGAGMDLQLMLSSAPFACGARLPSIPGAAGYLDAEPDLVASWAKRLGIDGFKIGLCWRGSQDWRADPKRSVPLDAFAPLALVPGVRVLSLQIPDETGAEAAILERLGIEPLGGALDTGPDAFVDTAAVMANLDLIVTCDTSIAHLAGALGRPTFVLLQPVPEWRWLLDRDDSPWYNSIRLFRQDFGDDWSVPMERLVDAVQIRVDKPGG